MQGRARGGPSRYRGVVWHKSNSKWEARIYEAGKQRFLGYFTSETEAARVYDEAARRIGGRAAKVLRMVLLFNSIIIYHAATAYACTAWAPS